MIKKGNNDDIILICLVLLWLVCLIINFRVGTLEEEIDILEEELSIYKAQDFDGEDQSITIINEEVNFDFTLRDINSTEENK